MDVLCRLLYFKIVTLDGWASEIARPVMKKEMVSGSIFFVSFIFIGNVFQ